MIYPASLFWCGCCLVLSFLSLTPDRLSVTISDNQQEMIANNKPFFFVGEALNYRRSLKTQCLAN
jgi:hypothetical protein